MSINEESVIKLFEKSKHFLFQISLLYTLLFIFFIAIPAYFYTQLEIENYKIQENKLLYDHASMLENAIYEFSNSTNDNFVFPKSFKFNVQLLNSKEENLFKTFNHKSDFSSSTISMRTKLSNNRLEAAFLVVSKEIYFKAIYLKILILSICISLFIFISIYLIIKTSVEPYKKANEYLDAFFNDAMHELKTPLGVIQLNLEILEEKHPNVKELTRSINAAKNLFLVYEDIEYLIKQKSVNYNKETIDFSYVLSQRIDQFESLTKAKNLIFNLYIQDKVMLTINRIQLQRIVDNTLSNAIKYSYKNSIIVINLIQKDDTIEFSVSNQGDIITDKKQIFNRYYKENFIKGGFGIGLNIVKNICQENHIAIIVESNKEQGTCFTYKFLI
ncbi:MAG: HAMP domain-containing sensor histidine kinase [Arcobacteraceae bacterium]